MNDIERIFREITRIPRKIYYKLKDIFWNKITIKDVKLLAKICAVPAVVFFFWFLIEVQYVKAVISIILGLSAATIGKTDKLDNNTARIYAYIFVISLLILLLDVFNINLFPLLQSLLEV